MIFMLTTDIQEDGRKFLILNEKCLLGIDCNISRKIIGYFFKSMVWHTDGAYGITDMGDFSGHSIHEFVIKK